MRPQITRPKLFPTVLTGSAFGIVLMSAASVLQKLVMGLSPDEVLLILSPRALLIPATIGMLSGGLLALAWYRSQVLADEARLASIVRHIGDISHDVKNLMTPVETGAQTLELLAEDAFEALDRRLDALPDEALRQGLTEDLSDLRGFIPEVVTMAVSGSENAASRAREIADAVKGEVAEPHFESTDINAVARSVIGTLTVLAEAGGTTLDAADLGDIPQVQLDAKLMHSAIYNLVNNAIPETPSGTIWVRTRVEPPPPARPKHLVIEIEDNGQGMPEKVRASLFTDAALSTKPGGTGLGTRIVANAVRAHGGDVRVVSAENEGTTFTMRLPARGVAHGDDGGAADAPWTS